tara:strand:+ start:3146 stop:3451 length:306 start_codon:yes stop_codon:yes gene_type:complete
MLLTHKVLRVNCIRNNDSKEIKYFHQRLVQRRTNLKTMLNNTLVKFEELHDVKNQPVKQHDINLCFSELKLLSSSLRSLDQTISVSKNAQQFYETDEEDIL